MQLQKEELYRLTEGWLNGTLTIQEENVLNSWYEQYGDEIEALIENDTEDGLQLRMLNKLKKHADLRHAKTAPLRRMWLKYAAAIVLFIGLGAYLWNTQRNDEHQNLNVKIDVPAPESAHAIITLGDGKQINLDSALTGALANQGNVSLKKMEDGQIVYSGSANTVVFNTLSNPRGSKVVNITLVDGTKVWLNSESSIKYPTAFITNKRVVEISGEAYFEVAPDSKKTFIVKNNNTEVAVLGTHFNVNSYVEEADVKVTLLEGSVKVTKANVSRTIKPGEQAKVGQGIAVLKAIDIEEVMAWKNGKFQFEDASIESIMNQVARWYNAEIIYEGKIEGNFVVSLSRELPVSKLLNILSLTEKVKFEIKGNKIIVRPN